MYAVIGIECRLDSNHVLITSKLEDMCITDRQAANDKKVSDIDVAIIAFFRVKACPDSLMDDNLS